MADGRTPHIAFSLLMRGSLPRTAVGLWDIPLVNGLGQGRARTYRPCTGTGSQHKEGGAIAALHSHEGCWC
eukprot:1591327-Pyramimonas_sp.AAC.1